MTTPLRVGDVLYGYCGGHFGRDSYEDKRVEAIGADWVVVRGGDIMRDNAPDFYDGSPEDLCQFREAAE